MKHYIPILSLLVTMCACPNQATTSPSTPNPPIQSIDNSACQAMCDHIGPKGLNCPEGQDVYDSDKAGPKGVPNETCDEFCVLEQDNGLDLNPACVAQAPTCGDIETWRLKTCK